MQIRRGNPKAFETLQNRLKALEGKQAKAGWFETSKYADGTPVAYIASIQEYGAHINHPGGTPYRVINGRTIFVAKNAPGAHKLPVTKPHSIVISPRPFMRPTVDREKNAWFGYLASGAKAIIAGNATADQVMEQVGLRAAADIARSITLVTSPLLARGTIRARLRRKSDKKTVGNLDKPLIDSGKMYQEVLNTSVNHKVENAT